MAPKQRRRWAPVLRLAVAVGLLGILFHEIPLARVARVLSVASVTDVALAFALALVGQVVISLRFVLLTRAQGTPLPLGLALAINLESVFYGLMLPGGNVSRSAIRVMRLAGPTGDVLGSIASVAFDRLAATVALGLVGQAFWLLDRPPGSGPAGLVLLATWVVPAGFYGLARGRPLRWTSRLGTAAESVRRFADLSSGTLGAVLALSIAAQLLTALVYSVLAAGLDIEIPFVRLAWIASVTTLITMLPVSPAGLGIREGTLLLLLGKYGVASPAALALSFLFFACTIVLVGLAGGLLEARRWFSKSS